MSQASRETQTATYWLDQGLLAITQQDYTAARAAFEQARALAPDRPDAYLNLGSLAQAQQQHEEAVSWYDQALGCDPLHWQARYCRALSLAALQRWERARQDLDQVIAQAPNQAEPYFNRGYVAQRLGQMAQARIDFHAFLAMPAASAELKEQVQRWLAQFPAEEGALSPEKCLQLARQAYLAGDGGTALRHYDAVLSDEPHHREALLARVHLYAVLGQEKAARQDLALLMERWPQDGELWYHQAVLLRRWGEEEAAWESLQQAKKLSPNLPEIYQELGALYAEKNPTEAIVHYSESLRLDPQQEAIYLARGKLYQERGQELLAVADYRQALQLDSTLVPAYDGIEAVLHRFSQHIEQAPDQIRPYIARADRKSVV
jgi:tetratricopeptide (TPR) repeat protein